MSEEPLRIYMRHLRGANMCNREPRIWFKRNNLNWSDFIANGIAVETLLATGDDLVKTVIEVAQKERDVAQR